MATTKPTLALNGKFNKEGTYVPAKNLAQVGDDWYAMRAERLRLEKEVEALKANEALARNHLIDTLPVSQATGIAGKLVRVSIVSKEKPVIDAENGGWDKLYKYIQKEAPKNPGVWSLLQKRLGEATVKEVWESGKKVPGVIAMTYKDISYSAVKG